MLLSVVYILLRYFLCFTDTNIRMYACLKNNSVRPLVNRNNIVILHLIQIQKRLFLIGFTINIIQLEMIKETIVKPYRFTQGFYPSVSLFFCIWTGKPIRIILFLFSCTSTYVSAARRQQNNISPEGIHHTHAPAHSLPDLVTASLPALATSQFFFPNTTLSEFRWRGWGCPLFLTSYCSVVWTWTSPSQRFFPCLHRIGVRNATGA